MKATTPKAVNTSFFLSKIKKFLAFSFQDYKDDIIKK